MTVAVDHEPRIPTADFSKVWSTCQVCGDVVYYRLGTGQWTHACTCSSSLGCSMHGPQPREQSVLCLCGASTWNVNQKCDRCLAKEAA